MKKSRIALAALMATASLAIASPAAAEGPQSDPNGGTRGGTSIVEMLLTLLGLGGSDTPGYGLDADPNG